MRKPESKLVGKILDALAEKYPDSYFRKIHGNQFQHAGIPDLIGCISGWFVAMEVKLPGQEPRRIQDHELTLIAQAGGINCCVTSVQDALLVAKIAESRLAEILKQSNSKSC